MCPATFPEPTSRTVDLCDREMLGECGLVVRWREADRLGEGAVLVRSLGDALLSTDLGRTNERR